MVKILEMQHELTVPSNYQSRIVEADSFDSYLKILESGENILPDEVAIGFKTINKEKESIIFMFEHNRFDGHAWREYVHFAQVIDEGDELK